MSQTIVKLSQAAQSGHFQTRTHTVTEEGDYRQTFLLTNRGGTVRVSLNDQLFPGQTGICSGTHTVHLLPNQWTECAVDFDDVPGPTTDYDARFIVEKIEDPE